VQALTPTLFPCYAPADRDTARRIAAFLDRGADVRVFLEEGELRPGEDLAAKAREALTADVVLVLFSRSSLPPRWPRAEWEAPLVTEPAEAGVRIAFVRCDDCVPPRVLAPMFEAKRPRDIKRWFRNSPEGNVPPADLAVDVEVLGLDIADRAGVETVHSTGLASAFADAFRGDFDAVIRVPALPTLAAAAGDATLQLGLRLGGELAANLERLHAFCTERRLLVILEGEPRGELVFGGRTSTLICTEPGPCAPGPLRDAQRLLFGAPSVWSAVCAAARQGRRQALDQGRLAECHELMERWRGLAEERDDLGVLDEAAREIVWILESWGRTDEAALVERRRALSCDEQIPLF